jgi:hypothetical protein
MASPESLGRWIAHEHQCERARDTRVVSEVMLYLKFAIEEPVEDEDPEVLRNVIDTCRDQEHRAELALAEWGPA